ncbi:MAG: nitroreductase family protein [Candidatus Heimdallarchaeota archaeon]
MVSVIENSKVIVDEEICNKCGACANECQYYYFDSGNMYFKTEMDEFCIECGKCVAICPVNAIKLKVHKDEILKDIPTKEILPSFDSFVNLVQSRRSRRQFKEISVPKELIENILNSIGRYSPTASNQESVYFTVIQNREILKKLSDECTNQVSNLVRTFEDPQGKKNLEKAFSPNFIKRLEASVPKFKRILKRVKEGVEFWRWGTEIIIIHSPKDSSNTIENCSLAACHIMLAAEALGLGTCSLGYITAFFNQFKQVAKIANIPSKHIVGYTLAIGYPKARYYRIPARKPLKVKWI